MNNKHLILISLAVVMLTLSPYALSEELSYDVFKINITHSSGPQGKPALVLNFKTPDNWHFYASKETAPGEMNLTVTASEVKGVKLKNPIFPESHSYYDKTLEQSLDVFSGEFTILVPYSVDTASDLGDASADFIIEGAYCSEMTCRIISDLRIKTRFTIDPKSQTITDISSKLLSEFHPLIPGPAGSAFDDTGSYSAIADNAPLRKTTPAYPVWMALLLAFIAGLSLNIMPCVWPVLPIIVMKLVSQSEQSRSKAISMGLVFCLGILLFFLVLAVANVILQVFYGTVLQWGDPLRIHAVRVVIFLLLILLALFMFGLFTINLPSSITSKSGSGKGYSGALGMGFLAAILSTPCSFAILAAAFAWAQAQPLLLATVTIMIIGVGMALPYAVLTSIPGLLEKIPKPGKWMELFKQTVGFVLLVLAVKFLSTLDWKMKFLLFSVVISFCIWMAGTWVSFSSPLKNKIIIRSLAAIITIIFAWTLFAPQDENIALDWQYYDALKIEQARADYVPVLIKFTADWCLSCQVVDKLVFKDPEVVNMIKNKRVLAVKADTTTNDMPATIDLRDVYNEPGVPVTILFLPGRDEPVRYHQLSFADDLLKELQTIP